jgi:hypothetical protein
VAKIQVDCNCLNHDSVLYEKGSVVEMSDKEAAVAVAQGNGHVVAQGTPATEGVRLEMDPVERDIREGNFDAAKASGAISVPPASADPKQPAPAVSAAGTEVYPLGDFGASGKKGGR